MLDSNKNNKVILIVEDEAATQKLISIILEKNGYSSVLADNGIDAINTAKKTKPDLIILDIMLPQMDGIEVCEKLSKDEETKNIPIIMLTVRKELSTKLAAYMSGARRYITKPFEKEELLFAIEKTLKQSEVVSNAIGDSLDPRD